MAPTWLCSAALLLAAAPSARAVVLVTNATDDARSGTLMRREMQRPGDFAEENPPESARTYSSIWGNDGIGFGHARSMLDSPQAWSAAGNNKDQWVIVNLQRSMFVQGVFLQSRNQGSCCGNQIVTEAHFEYSPDCVTYTPVQRGRVFRTGVVANVNDKVLVTWKKPKMARCVKVWPDLWENHISMRVGISARQPTEEDMASEKTEYLVINPPDNKRIYSSVWDNNAPGTGHQQGMLDSPVAWCAGPNRKGEFMTIDNGEQKTVRGAFFQNRFKVHQIVTQVYFEHSKDCVDFTPVENSKIFPTNVKLDVLDKFFVKWAEPQIAKCVRIGIDGWMNHISVRAGLSAKSVSETDKAAEDKKFWASNPAEETRSYSSVWGNEAPGVGHARSKLDSPQAWSAGANNGDQWMVIQLPNVQNVNGVYFQDRNYFQCCGNQRVTQVTFATSEDCVDYVPLDDGKVFATGVEENDQIKRFVQWPVELLAKCVKINVVAWAGHISMRAGLSVGHLQTKEALLEARHAQITNKTRLEHTAPQAILQADFSVYGDGTPTQVAGAPVSGNGEGAPKSIDDEVKVAPEVQNFDFYGDGTPTTRA